MSTGPGQTALTRIPLAGDLASGGLGQADHRVFRGDIRRHPGHLWLFERVHVKKDAAAVRNGIYDFHLPTRRR